MYNNTTPKTLDLPEAGVNMAEFDGAGAAIVASPSDSTSKLSPTLIKVHPLLGPNNTIVDCPFCHKCVKTTTSNTTTTRTHNLAFKCFWLCCCCLPYCMDSAQNTDHFCPGCSRYLGTYKK